MTHWLLVEMSSWSKCGCQASVFFLRGLLGGLFGNLLAFFPCFRKANGNGLFAAFDLAAPAALAGFCLAFFVPPHLVFDRAAGTGRIFPSALGHVKPNLFWLRQRLLTL